MSKNKNRQQYRPDIIKNINADKLENTSTEDIIENTAVEENHDEIIEPIVDNVVDETVENENNDEVIVEEAIVDTVENISTEPVEESHPTEKVVSEIETKSETKDTTGKYTVYVLENGSPLQLQKVLRRLNTLGIPYKMENENSIITNILNTESEAIKWKKYLAGKGLKPIIKK